MLNLTNIIGELSGGELPSNLFCWLPDLCETYPDQFNLGFALSFDEETQLSFEDENKLFFNAKSIRIKTNKEDQLLHDFKMLNVTVAMNLFINQDGSLDGSVETLHFTGGEIVTPAQLLVNPRNIGWIAQTFASLEQEANGGNDDGGLHNDHLRDN